MKNYRITLYTKENNHLEKFKEFMFKAHEMGYSFKEAGIKITLTDAIALLLKNNLQVTYCLEKDKLCFYAYVLSTSLALEANFESLEAPLWILREFIALTDSWLLHFINISFYPSLFSNQQTLSSITKSTEEWKLLYKKHLAKTINAIHGFVIFNLRTTRYDGVQMMLNLQLPNYELIKNEQILDILDALTDISEEVDKAIYHKQPFELYLLVEMKKMKLTFNGPLVSLIPIEPIKMKTVNGNTDIDIAFYVTIYLNLIDKLEIEDLFLTFP